MTPPIHANGRPRFRVRALVFFTIVFLSLVAVVTTAGRVHPWFRAHLGDALIVMLIYAAAVVVWLRVPAVRLALATFAFACLVEFSQLWQPPALRAFRATWLGRMTIGGSFDRMDFVHYAIGCVAAVGMDLTWLQHRIRPRVAR